MADMTNKKAKPAKKSTVNFPSKKTMNFVHHESGVNLKKVIPVVLVVLILAAVFAKFAILDPLAKKEAAQNQLDLKLAQLDAVNTRLAGYEELEKKYGRYSYGWMDDTEINMVSRMDVLHLVEDEIASIAFIDNLAVNNNVLTLNIHGITLEQASAMVKSLEDRGLVQSAAVYNAVAQEAQEAEIFMSIILAKEAE